MSKPKAPDICARALERDLFSTNMFKYPVEEDWALDFLRNSINFAKSHRQLAPAAHAGRWDYGAKDEDNMSPYKTLKR